MKLKLLNIVNATPALRMLGAEKMPIRVAYNIQRNIRLLAVETATYEKIRQDLIKNKYGKKTNESFTVTAENMEAFTAEMDKLGQEEIDMDVHTVNLSDFGDIKVSPNELQSLDWMFVE